MKKPIEVGDTFKFEGRDFVRLPDNQAPIFECERIMIHCLPIEGICAGQTFGTEPEWFRQRGFEV
jgi:hypothetical protein